MKHFYSATTTMVKLYLELHSFFMDILSTLDRFTRFLYFVAIETLVKTWLVISMSFENSRDETT